MRSLHRQDRIPTFPNSPVNIKGMKMRVSVLSRTLTLVLHEDKSKTIINTLPLRKI